MESKFFMAVQKGIAEEFMGVDDLSNVEGLRKDFDEHSEEFDALESLLTKDITDAHEEFETLAIAMFGKHVESLEAAEAALERMELVDEFSEKSDITVDKVEEAAVENMEAAMAVADMAQSSASTIMITFSAVGFIVAFILGVVFSRSITEPLVKSVDFATAIAAGDLSANVSLDQEDEVGVLVKALNEMAQKLRDIVGDVVSSSANVASGSEELSSTSEEMSQGSSEQASAAEEASGSLEQMASTICLR